MCVACPFLAMTIACFTLLSNGDTVINTVEIPGDIMVAGIFSVQENKNGICSSVDIRSVMNVEAIRWYFDNLNSTGSIPFQIGLLAYKTCRIRGKETESMIDIISRSRTARDSKGSNRTYIVGVIGPELSSEAEVVSFGISSLQSDDQLLQIGFSTTAAVLGDTNLYPNFYRVIPNDKIQVKVMAKAIERLGWTRFAIVHESDTYAKDSAYALKAAVEDIGKCVPFLKTINVTSSGDINQHEILNIVDDIVVRSNPPINGVVFFGTTETAKFLLITANSKQITSLPIFFMSEGVELSTKVFYDRDILISKALGAYAVSSPFKKVTEFQAYWTSLFRNTTKLLEKSQSNPWLIDAFEKISNCRPTYVKGCNGLTDIQIANASIIQSVYTRYALLAAHAISKTLVAVLTSSCGDKQQICQSFLDSFRPRIMSERLQAIKFDTEKDFGWGVLSLSDRFSFNSSREIVFHGDTPIYELFNFQKVNQTNNVVDFEKIGTFKNEDLELNTEKIRDYDENQREIFWPSIRRAECLNKYICRECIKSEIPDLMIHIPGDLYVVGLVPINDRDGAFACNGVRVANGYQLVEALKYGVEKFNTGGEYSSIFGGNVRIGLLVLNSCNSGLVVKRKILDIHSKGVVRGQSTVNINKRVLGYVGALGSSVSIASAQVLSQLGYVQVSYASTSSQLSNRNDFPYFMRVITPDNNQADVMIELIKQLNSEYVQLIYSDETYGQGGRDSLLAAAKEKKVCIVQPPISLKDSVVENFSGFYDRLRQNPHAKIVIIFLRSHLAVSLMKTLSSQMKKGEFIFIGSEAWGKNTDILNSENPVNLIGSFTVAMEMSSKEVLVSNIKGLFPEKNGSTPWMQDYLESKLSCYFNWSYSREKMTMCTQDKIKELGPDGWLTFAANAALSLLIGAGNLFKSKCPTSTGQLCDDYISNASGLVKEIKKVELDLQGTGIPVKVFDSNGDGNIGYTIYNIQQRNDKLSYEKVGQYLLDSGITLFRKNIQYPNDVPVESPCPNTQACEACFYAGSPGPREAPKQADVTTPVLGALVALVTAALIGLILGIIICRRRGQTNNSTYLTATYDASLRTDNPSGSEFPSDDRFTPPGSCSNQPSQSYLNPENKI